MLWRKITNAIVERALSIGEKGIITSKRKASGIPLRGVIVKTQAAPPTMTTVASILAADMLAGIISATPTATGATVAYTLPTGALMDQAVDFAINDSFDWTLINSALAAADTITVTAASGHTIVGGPIVQSLHATTGGITGYSAVFRTRKTAADTFVTYRVG